MKMNKKGRGIFGVLGIILLIISVIVGGIFIINKSNKLESCNQMITCEKYKCFEKESITVFQSINDNLQYQNCLLEQQGKIK